MGFKTKLKVMDLEKGLVSTRDGSGRGWGKVREGVRDRGIKICYMQV